LPHNLAAGRPGAPELKNRRALIYLALSLMTACWMTALMWTFLGNVGPPAPVTLAVLTGLTLFSLAFSRWLRGLNLATRVRQGLLAAVLLVLSLLVVSSGFYNDYGLFGASWLNRSLSDELSRELALNQATSLALVLMSWRLGLSLGDMRLTPTNLSRYFYVCVVILTSPSVFFVSDVSQGLSWLYFGFLFTAMLALGLGRVEEAARRSQDRGSPFTAYWLTQTALFAGLVLVLVGVAQALKLALGLGLLMVLVAPVLTALFYPLVLVGAKVIALGLSMAGVGTVEQAPADGGAAGAVVSQPYNPTGTQSVCAGLVFLVFFLGVVLAFAYSARRWRQIIQDHDKQERAAMPSLGDRVAEALEERIERLGFNLPGARRLRRRLATRSIRRIYAALIALGAERGYGRTAARTPYEHLAALKRAFPSCGAQVEQITAAYVRAHYGQVPETRAELREIKAAWEHVSETARRTTPASASAQGGAHA
jgi:hypothetical protein